MADTKISGLPASTVPLAGTEVLPIVQGSTTKQVSVANLTAGRAISASSVTNSALTSGRVTYAGTSGILQDSANFTFNGTTVTTANDASISGLTVGKGGGAISTNTSVGATALSANTSGNNNVAIGNSALASSQTGVQNTAIGSVAMFNATGSENVAVGYNALNGLTSGSANVAVGNSSILRTTTATNNTGVGYHSVRFFTGGSNTGVGYKTLNGVDGSSTGTNNTGLGTQAGAAITSGTQNTLIGNTAGFSGTNNLTTGSNNIIIGYNAAASSATVSNEITIGNSSSTVLRLPFTVLVANLPAAATVGAGARSFVTNALAPSFGAAVVGGGAVSVPVYSDGTTWNVG